MLDIEVKVVNFVKGLFVNFEMSCLNYWESGDVVFVLYYFMLLK